MSSRPPHSIQAHRPRHLRDGSRRQHKRVFVAYTGKVTEKDILRSLKDSLPNGVLDIKYQKNIADALAFIKTNIDTTGHDDPYDAAFIVADVDNLSPQALRRQRTEANTLQTPTNILLSNPCIEVWMACYTNDPPRSKLSSIRTAQSYVASKGLTYGKNHKKVRTELLADHFAAVETAQRLNRCCGDSPDFTLEKATTEFYKLIDFIGDEFDK